MLKKFLNIILIILVALAQISFINNQVFPFNNLNVILILLIFIALVEFQDSFYWILTAVFVLEAYSVYPFGILFISYCLTFVAIIWLFKNLFTNKSFYSLFVLGLIGILIYNVLLFSLNQLCFSLNFSGIDISLNNKYFISFAYSLILNLFFLAVLFFIYRIVSRKMKTVFLIK